MAWDGTRALTVANPDVWPALTEVKPAVGGGGRVSYVGALIATGGLVSIEPAGGGAGAGGGVLKPFILPASSGVFPGRGELADAELGRIAGVA